MNMLNRLLDRVRRFWAKRNVATNSCNTRYPVLLVHGIAYRDDMVVSSWGGIPQYLRCGGARVYLADTQAWASYETNGQIIKNKISEVLQQTGADKVNIIAHSKGGVDARYAICALQLADKVASLTTIGTPHRGTCIADVVVDRLPEGAEFLYEVVNFVARLMGDKKPDASQAVKELTRSAMRDFNERYPNADGVYYQSYGVQMLNPINDPLFALSYNIVKKVEGDNDGIISALSCRWGDYQGTVKSGIPGWGISHLQITGSVLDVIAGVNVPLLYVRWVSRLKELGY